MQRKLDVGKKKETIPTLSRDEGNISDPLCDESGPRVGRGPETLTPWIGCMGISTLHLMSPGEKGEGEGEGGGRRAG